MSLDNLKIIQLIRDSLLKSGYSRIYILKCKYFRINVNILMDKCSVFMCVCVSVCVFVGVFVFLADDELIARIYLVAAWKCRDRIAGAAKMTGTCSLRRSYHLRSPS